MPHQSLSDRRRDAASVAHAGARPDAKSVGCQLRLTLRKELLALSRACGVPHPSLVTADQLELLDGRFGARTVADFSVRPRLWSAVAADCDEVRRLMSWTVPRCQTKPVPVESLGPAPRAPRAGDK